MTTEKTYGQVLFEVSALSSFENWRDLNSVETSEFEMRAQAVITAFCERNGEAVAYHWTDNEGICGSPLTHYSDAPPGRVTNAAPLFLGPQPLPSAEEIGEIFFNAISDFPTKSDCVEAATEILALLKGAR